VKGLLANDFSLAFLM